MKNSRIDFNFLDRDNHAPVGYKDISFRLIFDDKMDLTRKARYVSGGNLTDPDVMNMKLLAVVTPPYLFYK